MLSSNFQALSSRPSFMSVCYLVAETDFARKFNLFHFGASSIE
nr:MAG TPA: hypothetical protein [Caudoviricetes sp.]DAX95053.1 MAG TPA: hypothetical protein [Caudoviricetes sp.]